MPVDTKLWARWRSAAPPASQLPLSAPTRAVVCTPVPRRRFRQRRQAWADDGSASAAPPPSTVGIAGTTIIATTITGAVGECDSLAQRSSRPASIAGLFSIRSRLP